MLTSIGKKHVLSSRETKIDIKRERTFVDTNRKNMFLHQEEKRIHVDTKKTKTLFLHQEQTKMHQEDKKLPDGSGLIWAEKCENCWNSYGTIYIY